MAVIIGKPESMAARRSSPLNSPLRTVTTPATKYTGETGIAVDFSTTATKLARMPVQGDTYKSAAISQVRMSEFKDYVCTNVTNAGRDLFTAYFFAPKTEAQKNQPYHKKRRTENYPWEKVVLDFHAAADLRSALEGRDPAGNAFYQNKWNVRYHVLEAVQGASQVDYEYFLSPTEFTNLGKPVIQQPITFDWKLPGDTSLPIGRALVAKRIRVPIEVLGPLVLKWRTYEPTVPNGRSRHLIDDDQDEMENGLWIRTRKYVNPPFGQLVLHDR